MNGIVYQKTIVSHGMTLKEQGENLDDMTNEFRENPNIKVIATEVIAHPEGRLFAVMFYVKL